MNSENPDGETEPNPGDHFSATVGGESLGFIDRIRSSCTNLSFYRIPLVEDTSKAFFYSLKLFLLIGVISGILFAYTQWTISEKLLNEISRKIPTIKFTNGNLDVKADTPYRMTLSNDYGVVIDPKGSLNRLELPSKIKIVVVNGAIFIRQGPKNYTSWSTRTYQSKEAAQTITINSAYVSAWSPYINAGVALVTLLATILAVCLRNYFRILILVPIGHILFPGDEISLNWSSIFNLACYAVTPIVLIETLLLYLNLTPPFADYLFLGLAILWFYFVLNQIGSDLNRSLTSEESLEDSSQTDNFFNDD